MNLPAHSVKVALVHPRIAPNTGNIARLCVASGTELHLVRPMGFVLSDRRLRRSAMDYWPRLKLVVHDDLETFLASGAAERPWLLTSKATQAHWDAPISDGDTLIFGSETAGLPEGLPDRYPDRLLRIPQVAGERCINLATAVGIVLYDALHKATTTGSGQQKTSIHKG